MPFVRRNPNREPLITPGQAARITGFSDGTIRRWCREGRIKSYITPGGHFRVYLSVVRNYIDKNYEWVPDEDNEDEE